MKEQDLTGTNIMGEQYTVLVVDDEHLARTLLEDYVSKMPMLSLVGSSANAMNALAVLQQEKIDILLTDIEMPEMTGVEFVENLPYKPCTIFTTAYSQYAIDSYDLGVVDYLLKPISFNRFVKAVNKAIERIKLLRAAEKIQKEQAQAPNQSHFPLQSQVQSQSPNQSQLPGQSQVQPQSPNQSQLPDKSQVQPQFPNQFLHSGQSQVQSQSPNQFNSSSQSDFQVSTQSSPQPQFSERQRDYMVIKADRRLYRVKYDDILYVVGQQEYVTFHTMQRNITALYSLKDLMEELPQGLFLRIHRSFIVSLKHVEFVDTANVTVAGSELPIGPSYRDDVMKTLGM